MFNLLSAKKLPCVVSRSQFRILDITDFLLIRGLFYIFLFALNKDAFCRVLTCVCEAKLRFCVKFCFKKYVL